MDLFIAIFEWTFWSIFGLLILIIISALTLSRLIANDMQKMRQNIKEIEDLDSKF